MRFTRVPFGWGPADYLALIMSARALELVKGTPKMCKILFIGMR